MVSMRCSLLVALFTVNVSIVCPALGLVTEDLEDASLVVGSVVVDTAEVIPMPLHLAVFAFASREVEPGPRLNLVGIADFLVSILLVDLNSLTFLLAITGELVVQDSIKVQANVVLLGRGCELQKLFFCSPFGSDASFLVKLAKIIQIIDIIAIACCGGAFASISQKFELDR